VVQTAADIWTSIPPCSLRMIFTLRNIDCFGSDSVAFVCSLAGDGDEVSVQVVRVADGRSLSRVGWSGVQVAHPVQAPAGAACCAKRPRSGVFMRICCQSIN